MQEDVLLARFHQKSALNLENCFFKFYESFKHLSLDLLINFP